MLSRDFAEVKKLRSAGNFASALPLVHSSKIESDEDAFEAMICLFVSGNLEAVLGSRKARMEEQMVAQCKPGAGRPDCPQGHREALSLQEPR